MRLLDPDAPLIWRIVQTAVPFIGAAAGFANGSVAVGVVFGLAGAFVFQRLFLPG